MHCVECHQETTGYWVDFGIGQYEYWGASSHDIDWAWVSKCCDAELSEEGPIDDRGNEP